MGSGSASGGAASPSTEAMSGKLSAPQFGRSTEDRPRCACANLVARVDAEARHGVRGRGVEARGREHRQSSENRHEHGRKSDESVNRWTKSFFARPHTRPPPPVMPRQSICVGVSGSVAAVKAPDIAAALLAAGVDVDLVVTEAAHSLMQAQYRGEQPWAKLQALAASHLRLSPPQESSSRKRARKGASESTPPLLRIHRDADEWSEYGVVGKDPVLHVELAKRNQVLLVAPLCANLLAQVALGFSGNLLSSVVRAWYYDLEVSTHPPPRPTSFLADALRPVAARL